MSEAADHIRRGEWWRHRATGKEEQIGNVKERGDSIYLYIPPKMRAPRNISRAELLSEWEPTGKRTAPPT